MAIIGGAATVGASRGEIAARPEAATAKVYATVQDGAVQTNVELHLPLNPFGQPISLDPHRAVNWGPFWVLLPHVWAGLLRFDENGAVVSDLAEGIEPNGEATVWRSTLKPDLTFASGRAIVADDFIASWRRALDPQALSPMATFMSNVDGFDAFTSGASADIGLTAIDDRTIEIRLAAPDSSFPAALATFIWAVVDLEVFDDTDVDDPLVTDAGAGAWRFTEFVDRERLVMEPNPEYWDEPSPSISRVIWHILDGADADARAMELYRADELAIADVPLSLLTSIQEDETLSDDLVTIESQASTLAIGLDFNQQPFGDVRVRRAIAAAVDRDIWASEIWQNTFVPATGFVPPVVTLTSGYTPAAGDFGDREAARRLLEQAGIDPETTAAEIVYFQPATDAADDIERHAALLRMIEDNSGLVIQHDTSLTADQIAARQRDNGGRQFDIVWWWTVTDTAAILDTAAHPDSPAMKSWFNWSPALEAIDDTDPGAAATRFQELIAEARASVSPETRNRAFQEAEQLLLDNAVYVPLGHWVQRFVQKPWLQGTRQGAWSGSIPVRIDADVVVRGREG
jgi:ABC-type transport system substrate-binding protein